MELNPHIEIRAVDYGGPESDIIYMSVPSIRRQNRMKNDLAREVQIDATGLKQVLNPGNVEILNVLQYIEKAPFPYGIDSFLTYLDALPDGGNALYTRMSEVQEELQSSSPSQA